MDGTLYTVCMPKFLRNYKLLLKTFYVDKEKILCMLILNVLDNGLACDCGVSRVLIMTYHQFCKKYYT